MTTGDISSQSVIPISSHTMWDWTSNHVTKFGNSIQLHNVTFQSMHGYTCAIQFKNTWQVPCLPLHQFWAPLSTLQNDQIDTGWVAFQTCMLIGPIMDCQSGFVTVILGLWRKLIKLVFNGEKKPTPFWKFISMPISCGLNMYHSLLVCVTADHKSSEGFMRLKLGRTRTSTFDHIPHQLLPQ